LQFLPIFPIGKEIVTPRPKDLTPWRKPQACPLVKYGLFWFTVGMPLFCRNDSRGVVFASVFAVPRMTAMLNGYGLDYPQIIILENARGHTRKHNAPSSNRSLGNQLKPFLGFDLNQNKASLGAILYWSWDILESIGAILRNLRKRNKG